MPHAEKHAPDAFSWMEPGTSDQNEAKAFYKSLFGRQFSDSPMGPDEYCTMFTLEGRNAAATYTLRPEQVSYGVPPHWDLYVSVAGADAAAKHAAECGGAVLAGPFDVATYGRMAVIRDPTGAVFSLRVQKSHTGIGIQGHHAGFCRADLSPPDPQRAAEFHAEVFGWSMPPGEGGYLHITRRPIGRSIFKWMIATPVWGR